MQLKSLLMVFEDFRSFFLYRKINRRVWLKSILHKSRSHVLFFQSLWHQSNIWPFTKTKSIIIFLSLKLNKCHLKYTGRVIELESTYFYYTIFITRFFIWNSLVISCMNFINFLFYICYLILLLIDKLKRCFFAQ